MVDRRKGALEAARGGGSRQHVVVAASRAAPAVFPVVHFKGTFVVVQVHHHGAARGAMVVCGSVVAVSYNGQGVRRRRVLLNSCHGRDLTQNRDNAKAHLFHHRWHDSWLHFGLSRVNMGELYALHARASAPSISNPGFPPKTRVNDGCRHHASSSCFFPSCPLQQGEAIMHQDLALHPHPNFYPTTRHQHRSVLDLPTLDTLSQH